MNIKFALPLICGSLIALSGCAQENKAPTASAPDAKAAPTTETKAAVSSATATIKEQAVETLKLDREDSTNIKVGNCFNEPTATDMTKDAKQGDLIASVPMRKCNEPHDYEVFASFKLPDAPTTPDDKTLEDLVDKNCTPLFATYVGKPLEKSKLDYAFLSPSDELWATGDREVTCYAGLDKGKKLTQSIQGSKM